MRFGILGPLHIDGPVQPVVVRPPKQRALLAVLLMHANQTVSTDRLVDLVWNGAPPTQATRALHVHLSQLRLALHPEKGRRQRDQVLARRPSGYVLAIPPGALDLHCFEELVEQGRRARADGDGERTAERLREALALWRGPALADVDLPRLHHAVQRLEEARLAVVEERIDAELLLGHHGALIGELRELVDEHPMRERLCGQLLLALYRAGRQAEALAAFARMRARLIEDLGIEPGAELQRLQRQILEGDAALDQRPARASVPAAAAPERPVPHELPADVATFTGRAEQVARLLGAIGAGGQVVISAIGGMGGIGKSALAIHVAHRLAPRFPGGQLYANLHGATGGLAPLDPLEVLGRFLRALGVDARRIPTEVDEAAARFRSLVADRRLLVLLDDARDAAQVAPLLPASPGSAVLVTSRRVLAGLDGATHLHLDVLSQQEAVALLGRLAGEERIAADPQAAEDVAVWCGYLPLALRVAAARLAARPAWPVRALADRLADEQQRLDELELGDIGARASLDVSLQELATSPDPVDQDAAAAFPLLSLPDGPDLSVPVVARLLDRSERWAARLLERLVDAQLVESPTPGRYQLHDLLRLYAREHAARRHDRRDRDAALERVFRFYVGTAWGTHGLLRPKDHRLARVGRPWTSDGLRFQDLPRALEWLEAERPNLLAAVTQAATSPGEQGVAAVQLAQALFTSLWLRSYWQDCVQINQTVLLVAEQTGDRVAQALAVNDLAGICWIQGRYPEAVSYLQESLTIARELGDRHGEANALANLGSVWYRQGFPARAVAALQESLTIARDLGDLPIEGNCLDVLGLVHWQAGRYELAAASHQEAMSIRRRSGDRQSEGVAVTNLGRAYSRQGRYDQAVAHLQQALAIAHELGDHQLEADTLAYLGWTHTEHSRPRLALACFERSYALYCEGQERHGQADCLSGLGTSLLALGQHERARSCLRAALAIFEELQTPEAEGVRALLAS